MVSRVSLLVHSCSAWVNTSGKLFSGKNRQAGAPGHRKTGTEVGDNRATRSNSITLNDFMYFYSLMNHTPVHLREKFRKRSFLTPPRNRRPSFLGLSLYRSGAPAPNRVLPGRCGRRWCFSHSVRSPPSAAPKSSPAAWTHSQPITTRRAQLPSQSRACASTLLLRPRHPVLLGAMGGRAISRFRTGLQP